MNPAQALVAYRAAAQAWSDAPNRYEMTVAKAAMHQAADDLADAVEAAILATPAAALVRALLADLGRPDGDADVLAALAIKEA